MTKISATDISSPSAFSAASLGFTSFGKIFSYVIFYSNHSASHIPSSWMVPAQCVLVAVIHLYRTCMSVPSSPCNGMHASILDLGLYSHLKEQRVKLEPMLIPREKIGQLHSCEEGQTSAAASCRIENPRHYHLSYSGPMHVTLSSRFIRMSSKWKTDPNYVKS